MSTAVSAWAKKLATDAVLLCVQVTLVLFLYRQPTLLLALLVLSSLTRILVRWDRRHAICWLGGSCLMFLVEVIQTAQAAWTFPHTDLLTVPLYMFPLWGQTFLTLRAMICLADAHARPYWSRWRFDQQAISFIALWFLSVGLVGTLGATRPEMLAVIHVVSAATILVSDPRPHDLLLCLVGTLGGLAGEVLLVQGGVYSFAGAGPAALAGLPLWLPCWWVLTVAFLRRLRGRIEML